MPATRGLWVEHRGSGFVGVVEDVEGRTVALRDDSGVRRLFSLDGGVFRLRPHGDVVALATPTATHLAEGPRLTASGAVASPRAPARVARADRILVEGVHDAELLEKVWGDELRPDGLVVEPLGGVDDLVAQVRARVPGPQARLGILLDHLVPGSKETRLAEAVAGPHVAVDGHPFVDVWQAVRPQALGLSVWPVIPPGEEWKDGICAVLGVTEPWALWRQILGSVRDYRDLEPAFVGAVERLLDFLLTPAQHPQAEDPQAPDPQG